MTSDGDVSADGCTADTFNSHITTNEIVFKHNDVEYMRYDARNNIIRISNIKSFLLQNIFTDKLRPLAFSNDETLYGGNATNDAYNENFRIMSSTETVSLKNYTK